MAIASNIQFSANNYIVLIFFLLLFIRQMMIMISTTHWAMLGGPESPVMQRLLQALAFYNCLLTFCFLQLDVLIQRDDELLNIQED